MLPKIQTEPSAVTLKLFQPLCASVSYRPWGGAASVEWMLWAFVLTHLLQHCTILTFVFLSVIAV